eukprot:Skav209956  [mRNA]  locus=scaffold2335:72694:89070:- [translate_table: standard]
MATASRDTFKTAQPFLGTYTVGDSGGIIRLSIHSEDDNAGYDQDLHESFLREAFYGFGILGGGDDVKQRVSLMTMMIVPVLAKIAGNNDPDENAVSHVFGQGSVCVAMDFPGWFEAATVVFFLAGISSGYAVYTIYKHCKELWGGKQLGLSVFMGMVILLMNLFWMVTYGGAARAG